MSTHEHSGLGPFADLTPERLARDITYYERKAAELDTYTAPREVTMRRLYQTLAANRQGLLAALRDGQPELWTDYTGRESAGISDRDPG